jgi:hypothetical protein
MDDLFLLRRIHPGLLHPALCLFPRLDLRLGQREIGSHPIRHVHCEVLGALNLTGVYAVDGGLITALQLGRFEGRIKPQRIQVHLIF